MHTRTTGISRARSRGWRGLTALLLLLPTIAVLGAQAATPAAIQAALVAVQHLGLTQFGFDRRPRFLPPVSQAAP